MTNPTGDFTPTPRSRIKRSHKRAHYDRKTLYRIIDDASFCHIGYAIDQQPYVSATFHWRVGEWIYWHGSSASKMLRNIKNSVPICINITHFDGFVMARAAFHHSANYRTAMLFGDAEQLVGREEKCAALNHMMEHFFPGRMAQLRDHLDKEIKATTVLRMRIDEAAAKIRSGPPVDDDEDYETATCWAGVINIGAPPLSTTHDDRLPKDVTIGDDIKRFMANPRL